MPPDSISPDNPHAWLRHARSDLFIAENILKETLLEDHCFHAQQCVEKSLKALCIQKQLRFPYTHDLAELATLLFEQPETRPHWFQDAKRMTAYAVSGRYPGFDDPVSEEEWKKAVSIAKTVLDWATLHIGNEAQS